MTPRVSVVMAVFNGERYLRPAVESILGQSYSEFEFLVIDDGSTDSSYAIMAEYAQTDGRLIAARNKENIGLTASLDTGLALATGEFFARQDADDVSHPDRLGCQIEFLDRNPDVCLVGTATGLMDQNGELLGNRPFLTRADNLGEELIRGNYLAHGSILARRQTLLQVGGYRPAFRFAQDYDLWLRLSEICEVENLDQVLYWRRAIPTGLSAARSIQQARFKSLAQELARERREFGRETTAVEVESESIVLEEPSARLEASLGYLAYARDMFSVGCFRRGGHYFAVSVIAYPLNPGPWRWLIGMMYRRVRGLFQ